MQQWWKTRKRKNLILSLSHTNIVFLFVVDTKVGDVGYRFRKEFKGCGIVEGQVMDILEGIHLEKIGDASLQTMIKKI